MINQVIFMNGYGLYVLLAFGFTFLSFTGLYVFTKIQYNKEKNKFTSKFGALNPEQANLAKLQRINKEILSNASGN
ncbi:MAG: heme exporter protein CcmD [Alphaproteobacteria bacterium]|nr:heme exporter protein CcmD [Alphaproteobacteria bacterium]